MEITHSYVGSVLGSCRYAFYLLFEDYIEAQSELARKFDPLLERFARNIGHSGVVVRPFTGDIETTRNQVLLKEWTHKEREEFRKTPGLLIIEKDFDNFNPQGDRWLYLNFGEQIYNSPVALSEYDDILSDLAEIISGSDGDFFEEELPVVRRLKLLGVAEIFEAKPEIFGFSVDLKKAASVLREMFS